MQCVCEYVCVIILCGCIYIIAIQFFNHIPVAGSDYVRDGVLPQIGYFAAGSMGRAKWCFLIHIIDDTEIEHLETFFVHLLVQNSGIILKQESTCITIIDNDSN